jgi:type VI secretion system protein ImpM
MPDDPLSRDPSLAIPPGSAQVDSLISPGSGDAGPLISPVNVDANPLIPPVSAEGGAAIPGWYGKLPSLGDFASRRLPVEFIQTWDDWLQDVLGGTRAALGDAWLESYLTMPIWRFVLVPGLVGEGGWAGVLMPSVDRVGRQFPLTVAAPLPSLGAAAHVVFDGADWLARLEEVALAALDVRRGPDDLDRELDTHPLRAPSAADRDRLVGTSRRIPSLEDFPLLARAKALASWSQHARWKGLWWTRGRIDGEPLMLASALLPTVEEFAWLVEGRPSPAVEPGSADATASTH